MDTKIISATLLLGRLITLSLVLIVVRKQLKLLKVGRPRGLQNLRIVLFCLGSAVAAGQIVPIIIDTYGIFGKGSFGLLLTYVYSNNITSMVSAVLLLLVYRLSEREK